MDGWMRFSQSNRALRDLPWPHLDGNVPLVMASSEVVYHYQSVGLEGDMTVYMIDCCQCPKSQLCPEMKDGSTDVGSASDVGKPACHVCCCNMNVLHT